MSTNQQTSTDVAVPRRARSRRWAVSASMVSAAMVLGTFALAAPASAATTAATRTQNLCGTPAPGQYRCLAIKRTDIAPLTAAPNATPSGLGPQNLQSAYNLPSTNAGGGQTVAIIDAYDNPNAESDLKVYRAQYGLPACTVANGCFAKVNQQGQTSPLPATNTGWAGEESLDVDMVSAICPNCHILLVEANTASNDLYTAVNEAVSLGAGFVSMSFGGAETSTETTIDAQYLTHPGVVITASSGDSGTGQYYPSSSPKVISVGGTSLTVAGNARGWSETAWTGGGSGCSLYEPALASQSGLSSCANRAATDISAVSDPATGLAVYQTYGGGGWTVYGGTSAASPMVSAAYALAGTRPSADIPVADLYTHKSQLNDVVSGSNGSCAISIICHAGVGWDGPSGLGTLNGVGALQASGASPAPVVSVTNPGNQKTVSGTAVSLPVQALDSAGSALAWRATGLPPGLSINSSTGLITGTPTTTGVYEVTITASDASGASAVSIFNWTITAASTPPPARVTVTNPGNQSTVANTRATVAIHATDSAGLGLTYRATGLPPGVTINAATAVLSGTPTSAATYTVTVTASDSSGASGSATFRWTVTAPTPPIAKVTVSNPGNQTTVVKAVVQLHLSATDSAGSALTYRATGLPIGLAINASTGWITGTPTSVGTYSVTVSASNASATSASASFSWTVTSASGGKGGAGGTGGHAGEKSLPSYELTSILLTPGASVTLPVPYGKDGLPAYAVSALQLNITATTLFGGGSVYIGPSSTPAFAYGTAGGGNHSFATTAAATIVNGSIVVRNSGTGYVSIQVYLVGYYDAA